MTPPPAFRPRTRDILQATVAAVGGAMLLVGIPILLWWAAHTLHYPTSVDWFHLDQNVQAPPVAEQLSTWLYHTYHALRLGLGTDGLVLVVLLVVAGLIWLRFVWLTLVELVLLVRDGTELLLDRAHQVGLRGWIASLLATLALSTTANAADATPAAPTTSATAPPQPGPPNHTGDTDTASAATTLGGHTDPPPTSPTTHLPDELRPDCPRYRVTAGDTLIRIAAQHLGEAARWRELAELNQPWLTNPNQLAPGWQLLLPPDTTTPDQPEVTEITVTAGDTLAGLAEAHLDDPERLGELYNLNAGRTQPDGLQLADADIVLPGWKLLVPVDNTGPPVDAVPAPPSPDAEPSARFAPHPVFPTDPQEHPVDAGVVSTTSNTAITLTGGGLVALGVAGAVAAAMRRQRQARDRSYHPGSGDRSQPPTPGPAVYALRLAADQHTNEETSHTADDSYYELDSNDVEIGVREDRTRAVNLATLHGLGLTGPGAEASVRALLVQLLATTDATLIIPQQDADALLGTELPISPRLQLAADEHELIEELAHRTASHPAPDEPGTPQQVHTVVIAEARRAPDQLHALLAHDTPGVAGLLLGPWPTGVSLRIRDDGLVTSTDPELADLHEARLFSLNSPDTRDLLHLLTETPSGTSPDDAESVEFNTNGVTDPIPATNTNTTREQDAEAEPALGSEPDPASTLPLSPDNSPNEVSQADDPDPAHHRGEFLLSILGPITLTTSDDHEDLAALLAPKHRALLVFLALHPRGTTRAAIREALWPEAHGRRPYNAFYAALSQIRKTLNPQLDRDGNSDLIVQRHEHVALNPTLFDVDYWHLLKAEDALRRASTHEQLTTAWERIAAYSHGELADGLAEIWLDAPREHARRTILDALSGLAAHHRDHGDPERQLQLLERARRISPDNEALYRDILRAHATLGQPDAINRTLDLLTTNLTDIGERPDASTLTLARALQAQQHQTAR